jgi:hypothetical protein
MQVKIKRIGTPKSASLYVTSARPGGCSLGEHRLAGTNQQVMADLRGKRVLFVLEPKQFGFQITNTLLEATHLVDHAEIRPADVAE